VPRLLYDHRENRSTIPGLLALEGFEMEGRQLPCGDYILSDRLAIERKTAADLVASIKDKRLWEQAERLRAAYAAVILIVEGEVERFGEESWKGALGSVMAMGGISVLTTINVDESAQWIARLARRESKGPTTARGAVRKPKDPDRLLESILTSLPGISGVGATRLLENFGSISAIFAADEEQLRAVPGIGRVRAHELATVFTQRWHKRPWEQ
jgi:ERCC4-type nuclease